MDFSMSNKRMAMPSKAIVEFNCRGSAVGKMRNELDVTMVRPFKESFVLATDEGAFHGGDATAPPPLALFIGGLTGCIMTQIRAFAKRLEVPLNDLSVDARIEWDWEAKGRVYETAPKSFELDIDIDSPASRERVIELIETAKKGCFIEQTLGQKNSIRHRMKTADGWVEV
jgi:uncharacterized OsmC-like protein